MDEKYVKVDDIVEYCNTYSACLQNKGQGVAQAALRRVTEFAKENSADVQPVKHGRWIGINEYCKKNGYIPSGMGIYYWCSECGKGEPKISDYCPNCGARMDLDSVTHDRCSNYYEMCIPECREGYNAQIAEYKKLLEMAVEDISKMPCNNDTHRPESCYICEKHGNCSYTDSFKWCKADIALKLIGETNEP